MDRIDKFLNSRPSKKKRKVRIGRKEVEITKEDAKKVRRYLNRECLDKINLHEPLNTSYSSIPGEPVIRTKKDISESLQKRKIENIKRVMHLRPVVKKRVQAWDIGECKGGSEFINLESYDQEKTVSEYVFGPESLERYYKELESLYLRPKEKQKNVKIDLLESKPRFPKKEVKTFPFGAEEHILGNLCIVGLGQENRSQVWDMKRNIPAGEFQGRSAFFSGEDLFFVQERAVYRRNVVGRCEKVFEDAAPEHPGKASPGWDDRAGALRVSGEGGTLALVGHQSVRVFDLKSERQRRFRVPGVQKVVLQRGWLYALTLSSLFVFGLQSPGKRVSKGGHDVSVGDVTVVASGEHVIVEGRWMHQAVFVRSVQAHQRRPLFCAVTTDDLRVFCYERSSGGLRVRLCRRVPGHFERPVFHAQHPWIYVLRDGKTRIYA